MEKAGKTTDRGGKKAFLHAAVMLGFAAFEAHVYAIADDFLSRPDLNPHERGVLAEHAVELIDGHFREKDSLKIWRLEDRVLFLCHRFSKKPIDRKASYWNDFKEACKLRNSLTHPKGDPPAIGEKAVTRALKAMIELLAFLFTSIYKRNLPVYHRDLSSKLSF